MGRIEAVVLATKEGVGTDCCLEAWPDGTARVTERKVVVHRRCANGAGAHFGTVESRADGNPASFAGCWVQGPWFCFCMFASCVSQMGEGPAL